MGARSLLIGLLDWLTFCSSALLAWLSWFRPASIEVIPLVGVAFWVYRDDGLRPEADEGRLCGSRSRRCSGGTRTWGISLRSYIAAWSAFSVVTLGPMMGNHWYVWLWPTMIGVPAIAVTTGVLPAEVCAEGKAIGYCLDQAGVLLPLSSPGWLATACDVL